MEQLAVPRGIADAIVARDLARVVPAAGNLIGLADVIAAAAFGHRLAERDDALAEA
jgi:hypothetical protein